MENMSKELIAFFSRAGENYFGGSYRYVDVRNTEIVAGMIHELTGAEMFRIDPVNPYSEDYETCTAEAKEGQRRMPAPRSSSIRTASTGTIRYISGIRTTGAHAYARFHVPGAVRFLRKDHQTILYARRERNGV